jgi:hypothetical protein
MDTNKANEKNEKFSVMPAESEGTASNNEQQ